MSLQTEMMEIGKERLTQMKVFLEDLQVQMALGKAEARETFDRERRNINEYIREIKTETKNIDKNGKKTRQELLDKLQQFSHQISRQAPGSKKSYDLWKKPTLQSIYELELAIKEGYGAVGFTLQTKLDGFKPKLDNFRINLALGDFEGYNQLEKPMEELRMMLDEMNGKMSREEKASEKIDHFAEEMNQSLDHMKKAFGELFS